jgi:LuxR family maltose regulon positive regulatory protein
VIVGPAYVNLAAVVLDRGRLAEAEQLLERAGACLRDGAEPAAEVGLRHCQGMIEMARGHFERALGLWVEAERLARTLRAPHFLEPISRQWQSRARLRLGRPADPCDGAAGCNIAAHAHLGAGDPGAAAADVAPVLDGSVFALHVNVVIEAHVLDALARTRMGDAAATERSLERALELGEPQGRVWIWLTIPGAAELLAAHPGHRTRHAAYVRQLLDQLAGAEPETPHELEEPLRERELAVLRFLPTNLSAAEIGGELYLSVHTVKTHMRKLYAKLGAHTRAEAVQRGRALGLLAPARRGE